MRSSFFKTYFKRDKEGKISSEGMPKHFVLVYSKAVVDYLNCLEPLFDKAFEKSEFNAILTLLRIRGLQDPGWDVYENSIETIDGILKFKNKFQGSLRLNVSLWLYGHIVESSEPYEILANMLNIVLGNGYRLYNFPKIKTKFGYRSQYPQEKINYLESLAKKAGMTDVVKPIKEVFDRDLRNAVFHSDYSVYNGEVRLNDPSRVYDRKKVFSLINKALAYHEVIKNLHNAYRSQYKESKSIEVPSSFSTDPNEKAILIIRKGYGVIGMKNGWTKQEIREGKVDWLVINHYRYEQKYINRGDVVLPRDRIIFWNKILMVLPTKPSNSLRYLLEKLEII